MMASIKAALYYHLTNAATVTALVASRVYPMGNVPTSAALPYVSFTAITTGHEHHQTGPSALANPIIQIDAWAATDLSAWNVADAIRQSMDSTRGSFGDPADSATVRGLILQDERDEYISPSNSSEAGVFRRSMDFTIWHTESIP